MIVTEEEAKTKRCQEGFGPPATADGQQSMPTYGAFYAMRTSPSNCIGSECMAWEWQLNLSGSPDKLGYCGKARRP